MLDAGGYLWLGTRQGLYTYADGMLQSIAEFGGDPIHAIVADSADGTLWIGSDSGLWRIVPGLSEPEKIPVFAVDATELDAPGYHTPGRCRPGPAPACWRDRLRPCGATAQAASGWAPAPRSCSSIPGCRSGATSSPLKKRRAPLPSRPSPAPRASGCGSRRTAAASHSIMFDDGLLSAAGNLGSSSEGGLDTDIVRAAVVDQDNTLWFASPVGVFRYQLWAWLETGLAAGRDGRQRPALRSERRPLGRDRRRRRAVAPGPLRPPDYL